MKMAVVFLFCFFMTTVPAFAYIDPATGNAIFTLAITVVSAVLFACQYLYEHFFLFKGIFQKNKNTIPLLLYSEGNAYWTRFEPILNELEKRQIKTVYYTSAEDDLCFQKKYQYIFPTFIGKGNKAYAKMAFVKADIVLMTTPGLDVYQLKRSRYVKRYVHFYHDFSDHCIYKLFGTDYYDTLLTDNEINGTYIRELEQKRNLPAKELVVVGNIRLDDLKRKIENSNVAKNKEKTILLSPSWGKESILYKYGDQIMRILLSMDYYLIVRPHPQMRIDNPALLEKLMREYPDNEKLKWDFEPDNLSAMLQSDLMISDFSSIVFEYAFTLNRPVITINKEVDLSQYDAGDLSAPTWRFTAQNEMGAGITEEDFPRLSEIIEELLHSTMNEKIADVADRYWTNKGKSVENIVNYLENSLKNMEGEKTPSS